TGGRSQRGRDGKRGTTRPQPQYGLARKQKAGEPWLPRPLTPVLRPYQVTTGAMRSSSSLTVNSIDSTFFPVSFFTVCFWVFVRSIRAVSFSLLMGRTYWESGGGTAELADEMNVLLCKAFRRLDLVEDHWGDALLELTDSQLDRFGVLTRLLLHDFLLGLRQVD